MAISYHVGSRKKLFAQLVQQVYAGVGHEPPDGTPVEKVSFLLERYCRTVITHPNLAKCIFSDMSLLSNQLVSLTKLVGDNLILCGLARADVDTLVGIVVDYTHGFSFSAAAYAPADSEWSGGIKAQTMNDFRRGLSWILERISAGESTQKKRESRSSP